MNGEEIVDWCGVSCMQINPNTAYVLDATALVDDGHGLAGVTFYSGAGVKLSAAGVKLAASPSTAVTRGVFVAPPGAYFAALWAGKWTGGGQLRVRQSPSSNNNSNTLYMI